MMGFYVKEKMNRRIIDTQIYMNINIRRFFLVRFGIPWCNCRCSMRVNESGSQIFGLGILVEKDCNHTRETDQAGKVV